jgi:adenylate kinase family enzyme
MNIFIIGLPKSGRTTIAKEVAQRLGSVYLSSSDWIKGTFRLPNVGEHEQSYAEDYHKYFFDRLKVNPDICIKNVVDTISCQKDNNFIIDGINSPRDFINLFDYNKDVVVILNRTDNESYHRDHDSIFISTIKDYCFWMASAELIDKDRWIEYNFKIKGDPLDSVKTMGTKNSVFLVKNINRVISHLEEQVRTIVNLSE